MILKPQDIVVLLKLVAIGPVKWSYLGLAYELEMSPSEVHAAVGRTLAAGLAVRIKDDVRPHIRNLEEFLVHGIKYVFVPERGELTRGITTSSAAAPLNAYLVPSAEPPLVWPDPEGDVRGMSFSPLYKSVPQAARRDEPLYQLLVLVDAIRGGRAREREIAIRELQKRLAHYA